MTTRPTQSESPTTSTPTAETAAKMQKLRRAVDRLRNLRGVQSSPQQRASWLERLRLRLGLASEAANQRGEE